MKQLHLKEMKEAAIAAKEKYLEDHPECADIDIVIYLCVKIS
jgi:outer membrane protein assembly factor BamD (BamD/ComL family)